MASVSVRSALLGLLLATSTLPCWAAGPDIDEDGLDSDAEVLNTTDPANADSDADMIVDGWEVQQAASPVQSRYPLSLKSVRYPVSCVPTRTSSLERTACATDDQGNKCWVTSAKSVVTGSNDPTVYLGRPSAYSFSMSMFMRISCGIDGGDVVCTVMPQLSEYYFGSGCNGGGATGNLRTQVVSGSSVGGNVAKTLHVPGVKAISGMEGMLCALTENDQENVRCWTVTQTSTYSGYDYTVTSLNFSPYTPSTSFFFDADLDGTDNISDLDDDNDGVLDVVDGGHYNPFIPMALDTQYNGSAIREQVSTQ